jgi:branched-chain amino acid transport system substrate-binding protein
MRKARIIAAFALRAVLASSLAMAAAAQAGQPALKVGCILPLSGQASYVGERARFALEARAAEIKARLGLDVELAFADDGARAYGAVDAYESLLERGYKVFIGPLTSDGALSLSAMVDEDGVIALSPTATLDEFYAPSRNFFRLAYSDSAQGRALARYALSKGWRRVAVVRDGSAFADSIAALFLEELSKGGGRAIKDYTFSAARDDPMALVAELETLKPDLVFIPGFFYSLEPLLEARAKAGSGLPYLASDGIADIERYELLGGIAFPDQFSPARGGDRALEARVREAYGRTPDVIEALCWDALGALATAARRAGAASPSAIRAELLAGEFAGAAGSFRFGPDLRARRLIPIHAFVKRGDAWRLEWQGEAPWW